MRIWIGMFFMVSMSLTWAQKPPEKISDVEAAQKAKNALIYIDAAKINIDKATKAKDTLSLEKIFFDLHKQSDWPMDHLAYRSLFPYFDCPQAMRDLANLSDARKDKTDHSRAYYKRKFDESYVGCKKAIRKPDLSLKDVQ